MYLWIDDMREPPLDNFLWVKSVEDAKTAIRFYERAMFDDILIIDLDHDAGDYVVHGGDYIKLLDWLEETKIVDEGYFFKLHTMNPVGRDNMRRIIQKNGWKEIRI